jgi:hypothetical protein
VSTIGPGYGVRRYEEPQSNNGMAPTASDGLTPLPPPSPLAILPGQSAAYLAFLRALGLNEGEDIASTQRAIDTMNARAGLTQADLADQAGYAQENVAASYENRGLLRSGSRLRDQARTSASYGRQMAGNELDLAMNADNLVSQLASRRAENERKRAEQAMNTTAGIYEDME